MDRLWDITLGGLLDHMAEKFPDTDCVVYADRPFRTTYAQFRDVVNEAAKGLMGIGVKKGDHISIWATNHPEWIITMFAAAKIGAVLVTVNTNYKIYEAEYLLRQSDTDTLILMSGFKDSDYVGIVNELVPELKGKKPGEWHSEKLPRLKNIIHIENSGLDGMIDWRYLAEAAKTVTDEALSAVQASIDVHDVVNMQYTSGTTGFPKGVMLTHHNIVNNGMSIGDGMKLTEKDRLCIPVPFFHCFGCVLGIMAAMTHGASMIPVEHFNPLVVMKTIQAERCTAVHGVPTMFIAMLDHPDFGQFDFHTLRTGIMAGSPCPEEVMRRAVDRMNLTELTIVYGLTESSPGCTQTSADDTLAHKVSTIGRQFPFMECKVVNPETGEECAADEPGEFTVRGYNIMKGYYNMPEATSRVIVDGWLHSGDMATRDSDGYYKIVGRIKDMIIRGGENIYPKEIEDFLYTHPKVSDVQVVGVPDVQYGEEACAFIVLKQGENATENEIKDFVRANLSRHKIPRHILFTDAFPMTASGKIMKYKLRDEAAERLGLTGADDRGGALRGTAPSAPIAAKGELPIKFGFSTLSCPDWKWDDIMTTAADLGFDGIELRGVGNEMYLPKSRAFTGRNLEAAMADLKRLNLAVACLTSGALLFDASMADVARTEVRDFIALAVKLGAPYVRVLADRDPWPGPVDKEAVEENLRALLPDAQAAGVMLLVETNGVYAQSAELKALCDKLNHPSLGVLWDVHHPYRYYGEPVRETYANLSPYIRHIHVKDSVMEGGKTLYRMTGSGDVPVREALDILRDNAYDGFVVLEWVKRWNMNLEEPGIVLPHFINAVKSM